LPLAGALAARLEQAAFFRASRFSVALAMGEPPLWGIADYAALATQTITIELANSAFGFSPVMVGQIDNVSIDCGAQRVTISGRDLSARMIDAEITETFVNQTASGIAAIIAGRHGLSAEIVPTTAIAGQYYEIDHARTALATHSRTGNEWDLLVWLAQNENYVTAVTGTTLYFGPLPVLEPAVIRQQDCIALSFDRALSLPGSARVTSWNTRNKSVVTQTAGRGASVTTLVKPNLSTGTALSLATAHLAALARHATIVDIKLPGELALTPSAPIFISGTSSPLDQIYTIAELVRELDVAGGFVETIRAYAA